MAGLFGFLSNLFGGKSEAAETVEAGAATEYKGFMIRPAPQKHAAGWLTAGVITKEFSDGVKEHRFIRADTYPDRDSSLTFCVTKGKQIVDEQGDRMFASAAPKQTAAQ
jgi:hypothetical protein